MIFFKNLKPTLVMQPECFDIICKEFPCSKIDRDASVVDGSHDYELLSSGDGGAVV
jgi:hypothetical protein